MKTLRVRDLMSTDLVTLSAGETLDLAEEVMKLARIRHLPVTSGGRLVGLVTHRDLLRASVSVLAGIDDRTREEMMREIPVADIMNREVETISPDAQLSEAAITLLEHKWGCLPVVDEDQELVGILTEADFLKLIARILVETEAENADDEDDEEDWESGLYEDDEEDEDGEGDDEGDGEDDEE